jgi:hypothetical protein
VGVVDDPRQPLGYSSEEGGDLDPRIVAGVNHHQHPPLSAAPRQDRFRQRGSIGSNGGGVDRSSLLSLATMVRTWVGLSPLRTASAGAPSLSRTGASRAWKNRSTVWRSF